MTEKAVLFHGNVELDEQSIVNFFTAWITAEKYLARAVEQDAILI